MRVADDERRVSGAVESYKLPAGEIEKIFKDVKPQERVTGFKFVIRRKPIKGVSDND
jgi:hypothetical protein